MSEMQGQQGPLGSGQGAAPQPQPERRSIGDNAGVRMLLPVGRSPLAVAAGYVALAGFLIFPAAPVAIILGILAMRDINRNPKRHGKGRAIFAIIAGSIVTLAILAWIIVGMSRL